ncbi:MAG: ZPR1 zinc finger domain-containing protein [archaeon]
MEKKVSMAIECPECKGKAVMTELIKEIPFFGRTLFSNLRCTECSFNLNDVSSDEEKKPMRFTARIESEKDLFTKIVKSSTSTVFVPEIGARIEPTVNSQGYFTNIEGLLNKIEESLSFTVFEEEERDAQKMKEKTTKRINDAKEARIPFKVIVEDPFGNGALIGKNVKKEPLTEKEVLELKKRMSFLES